MYVKTWIDFSQDECFKANIKDLKEDRVLIDLEIKGAERNYPCQGTVLSKEQAFALLDALGQALTDDYKSLDHYIRLQEREDGEEITCPYCEYFGSKKEFDIC